MKKLLFLSLLMSFFVFAPFSALANNTEKPPEALPLVPFTFIVGEKDDFQPENEYSITFARKITIMAEAPAGAKVSMSVSYPDELEREADVYDDVIIGASQKFIQPVTLIIGDNYIEIAVEMEDYEKKIINTVIKRKDNTILESLQNLIVIPAKVR